MKKLLIPVFTIALLSQCTKSDFQKADILVTGTDEPVISLNGTWKFTMDPPENFFMNEVSCSGWKDILVPGDCASQGFTITPESPYVYKTSVAIPSDFAGKIVKLRFEEDHSYTRVWVDGTFSGDHIGDSTTWDCDISKHVKPGTNVWLTVELTCKSTSAGEARNQPGGITGNVRLLAIPENYPEAINLQIEPDTRNKDAILKIVIIPSTSEKIWAGFRLYDPEGKLVRLNDRRYVIKGDTFEVSFPVKAPLKWNETYPTLYTVITELFNRSILTSSTKSVIEFRKEEKGRRLLFNRNRQN